jgi:hypothetical protein
MRLPMDSVVVASAREAGHRVQRRPPCAAEMLRPRRYVWQDQPKLVHDCFTMRQRHGSTTVLVGVHDELDSSHLRLCLSCNRARTRKILAFVEAIEAQYQLVTRDCPVTVRPPARLSTGSKQP